MIGNREFLKFHLIRATSVAHLPLKGKAQRLLLEEKLSPKVTDEV